MTDPDVTEILLLLLRQQRSESELLDDLAAQVQAIYDYLQQHDVQFEQAFSQGEVAAKSVTSPTKRDALRKLDDIIRKLESLRKPRVN